MAESVGLAEPGLYDKWVVRGPDALAACRSFGLEGQPGRVTPAAPGGINVWAIADNEVWLVASAAAPGGLAAAPIDVAPALDHLRAAGAHVTDVSSGWAVLRLAGPRVHDLLEELVAVDLAPSLVPDHAIVQLSIAGSRVVLARRDVDTSPGYVLLVARDEAQHLWEVFIHIGQAHGLQPVGAAALLPAGQATGEEAP